jgi:hypothetical protein
MIRALTYVMAAAILIWAVCEIAERVDSRAAGPRRAAAVPAAPSPSLISIPKPRGKGSLTEKETGRRFETR